MIVKTTKHYVAYAVTVSVMIVALLGVAYIVDQIALRNCRQIEELKAAQREEAQATIAGNLAFLEANPGGTDQFPEAVVRADIAAKQKTVDRFPPKTC